VFGSAPAPASGLFGSAPSTGGLFGNLTPAASSFGSFSSSTPYGSTPSWQQHQQQPQVPAQAALQAHLDASARQEAERVRSALEKVHGAYAGMPSQDSQKTQKFVSIQYTDITPEHRQLQWLHSLGTGGASDGLSQLVAPPKPPHVSEEEWYRAVVNNPDPSNLMPMALVGAEALQARLSWQQSRATELARHADVVQKTLDTVQQHTERVQAEIQRMMHTYDGLKLRILQTMRKVELARCMNQPLQPDEIKIMERMFQLCKQVNKMRKLLAELEDKSRMMLSQQQPNVLVAAALPDKDRLLQVLKDHRKHLEAMTATLNRDVRDAGLLQQHVVPKLAVPTRLR
jgi:nuclear pore complex protein Nup54